MSDLTNVFTNIADAIRAKAETQITYKPTEMANAINNISSGGGELVYNANGVSIQQWFNSPVTIAEGVTNIAYMFNGCFNFNQPVTIPNSVTNTYGMFQSCNNFNQPVTIPDSVTAASAMFIRCYNFNQPITIPNSVTSIAYMFSSCSNFNQSVTIPNSVTDTSGMFNSCSNFNQPITIPNSVINIANMFGSCHNFNQSVTIPDRVIDASYMFSGCFNFNQPVTIPDRVTSTAWMFSSCYNFNQPVIIPNNVTNIAYMFNGCFNFNQPVTIPDRVTSTTWMFSSCSTFNQPVIIPNNVTNASYMFNGCSSFNQPVIIPNSVTSIAYMFNRCYNLTHVFVKTNPSLNVRNMVRGKNDALLLTIETNDTSKFTTTTTASSITGTAITWTRDGDNYYNTAYNIYIHNVANPYTVLNNADYSSGNGGVDLANISSPAIVFGSGVRILNDAFSSKVLDSNNTLIMFEEGVENLAGCFLRQTRFNQPLTIPSSAVNCLVLMPECSHFNSPIVFRNGVKDIGSAISFCNNLASDIWIPESITNMQSLLYGTPYTSGNIHISHNIALGDTTNYIYNSLVNVYIGITLDPSRILNDY